MNSLIENAARALWAASSRPTKSPEIVSSFTPSDDEPDWQRFIPHIKAVLSAMREPTEEMAEGGAEVIRSVTPGELDEAHCSDAANTWRFMIDVALSEWNAT